MSNVLIGIIGVILFIGLALAGALFLGPRFQESTNNSRASAAVQAVSQVSNAANMYNVQEGKVAATAAILKTGDYLKSIPSNPTDSASASPEINAAGTFVTMPLGGNAKAICAAINKQTSGLADTAAAPVAATGTAGCFSANGTSGWTAFSAI